MISWYLRSLDCDLIEEILINKHTLSENIKDNANSNAYRIFVPNLSYSISINLNNIRGSRDLLDQYLIDKVVQVHCRILIDKSLQFLHLLSEIILPCGIAEHLNVLGYV